jgi:RimJ/RimL family protein N-acetyltransferase
LLRPAVAADFDRAFEIYMDPSVNPFMSWELMSRQEFKPIFDNLLASGNLYACEVESAVAAVIRLDRGTHRRSHVAYIGGFGVLSGFQNKGLGKRIMLAAIEKLAVEGFKRIELIVEGDNHRAIKFYENLGFQKEGTLRRFFKRASDSSYIDDYYMALLRD